MLHKPWNAAVMIRLVTSLRHDVQGDTVISWKLHPEVISLCPVKKIAHLTVSDS